MRRWLRRVGHWVWSWQRSITFVVGAGLIVGALALGQYNNHQTRNVVTQLKAFQLQERHDRCVDENKTVLHIAEAITEVVDEASTLVGDDDHAAAAVITRLRQYVSDKLQPLPCPQDP